MKKPLECKNCKWWDPWKLPEGKTLGQITKRHAPNARKGDCRNQRNDIRDTTFSTFSCDFAEPKED